MRRRTSFERRFDCLRARTIKRRAKGARVATLFFGAKAAKNKQKSAAPFGRILCAKNAIAAMAPNQSVKLPADRLRDRIRLRNSFHVNLLAEFTSTFLLLVSGESTASRHAKKHAAHFKFLLTCISVQYTLPHGEKLDVRLNAYINVTVRRRRLMQPAHR